MSANWNNLSIDDILEEQAARQNEYDDWKAQLSVDCLRKGIGFPSGYALQREWNAEQKRRAIQRKVDKIKEEKQRKIKALQAQIGEISQELADSEEPDFDAIDRKMQQIQDARESADRAAKKQQDEIFNIQSLPEPTPIFDNPMEDGDDSVERKDGVDDI